MLARGLGSYAVRTHSRSLPPRRQFLTFIKPLPTTHPVQCAPSLRRHYSSAKSIADERIDEITELFATAQDEFEIALEETEKVTVYAEEDRKAAREEFEKVKTAYEAAIQDDDQQLAEEVRRRVGQRVRELQQGIERMEEMARDQD